MSWPCVLFLRVSRSHQLVYTAHNLYSSCCVNNCAPLLCFCTILSCDRVYCCHLYYFFTSYHITMYTWYIWMEFFEAECGPQSANANTAFDPMFCDSRVLLLEMDERSKVYMGQAGWVCSIIFRSQLFCAESGSVSIHKVLSSDSLMEKKHLQGYRCSLWGQGQMLKLSGRRDTALSELRWYRDSKRTADKKQNLWRSIRSKLWIPLHSHAGPYSNIC